MQEQVEVFFFQQVYLSCRQKDYPPPFGDDVFCLGHMTALVVRGVFFVGNPAW